MDARARSGRWAAPLLLVLAVFVLYAQTARHAFVDYDTAEYLTANPRVLAGLSLENLRWAFTHVAVANWHPLTLASHMLDIELFGLAPAGHHLENAAWHAANALLVHVLFVRLGLARGVAFVAALVFALHPLRAESVAWIVERKDLLSSFFGLASLLAWLAWSREPRAWRLAAFVTLYACSLLSKAMLVTLPALLLVLEFGVLGRTSWRPRRSDLVVLGCAGLALGVALATLFAQAQAGALEGLATRPIPLRVANALAAYVWYLGHSLWPASLCVHYPLPQELELGASLLDLALLLALSLAAWRARRRLPLVLTGWLWFLGTLVPVLGLVQVGPQAHADRYTYFPTLGLLLAAGTIVERELLPRAGARVLAACGGAVVLALGVLGWRQVSYWRDTETLARRALEVTRDNAVACELLGDVYANRGRQVEALPYLREAARLAPLDARVRANLGGTLLRTGALDEAEGELVRASELGPARWQTWSLLGGLHLARGRADAALAALDRAAALEAGVAGVWLNRGRALEALGRLQEARDSFVRSLACPGAPPGAQAALQRIEERLRSVPGASTVPR